MALEVMARSACFLNGQTRSWVAAMHPSDLSKMPPWHVHGAEAAFLEAAAFDPAAALLLTLPTIVTDRESGAKAKCPRRVRGSGTGNGNPHCSPSPSPSPRAGPVHLLS